MSSENPTRNQLIPKGDTATIISAFVVVAGVVGMALEFPTSEIILGAAIGFLFKGVVQK